MKKKQKVADMADEVLARQARVRAERTGESLEVALKAVRKTEAGRQLEELSEGPHRDERAKSGGGPRRGESEERQRRRGQSG